jgi:hypothetical protein
MAKKAKGFGSDNYVKSKRKDQVVMQNIIKVRRGVDEAKVFLYKEV